jgi:hypothetical protein
MKFPRKYMGKVILAFLLFCTWPLVACALPTPTQAVNLLYKTLPNFPKGIENKEGTQNLGRRLITYHTFTKGRSPYSRFDWKLTLADYLGYNEIIGYADYPGREDLPVNPYLDDQKQLDQFTRNQREHLIQTLLTIYKEQ